MGRGTEDSILQTFICFLYYYIFYIYLSISKDIGAERRIILKMDFQEVGWGMECIDLA
jgi:hypothetical protein